MTLKKGWKNFYSKSNPFDIKKISPLRLGIKDTHSLKLTFARKGLNINVSFHLLLLYLIVK